MEYYLNFATSFVIESLVLSAQIIIGLSIFGSMAFIIFSAFAILLSILETLYRMVVPKRWKLPRLK